MLRQISKIMKWQRTDRVAVELHLLRAEINIMANELADLQTQASATADVLGKLATAVAAGVTGIDPTAVAAVTTALKTATDAAAAALQPPAPAPAPEPAPAPAPEPAPTPAA